PAVGSGVDERSLVRGERKRRLRHGFFLITGNGKNHKADLELVLLGELIIALIVRGDAHDGAGAIVHENVVRRPDGNLFAVKGIDGIAAGGDTVLFDFADVPYFFRFALLGDQLIDLRTKIG